jgi:hypothetical protein
MSTYDPNPPVGPIGYQPVEFLDIPEIREQLEQIIVTDWPWNHDCDPAVVERSGDGHRQPRLPGSTAAAR